MARSPTQPDVPAIAAARPLRAVARDAPLGAWLRAVFVPLAVALVCLRTIFHPGYLLQVDAVFGPRPGPVSPGLSLPVSAAQWVAVEVLGGAATGKLYALGALFSVGFAPMALFRRASWHAQCAGGFLGMLNPWVYDRMADGQFGLVAAAASLFLWLWAWESLQTRPGWTTATAAALCGALAAAFSPHALGPLGLLIVAGCLWTRIWRDPRRFAWAAVSVLLMGVLLLPTFASFFVTSSGTSYAAVRQFTSADFAFFRSTRSPDYGLVPNLVGLYGYWGERIGRFPVANEGAPWWPLAALVISAAAVAGAALNRSRAWLLVCGVIGLAVSASTALPGGVRAAAWLASRIPLVGAYREPEKWSVLWLLATTVLAAGSVEAIMHARRLSARGRELAGPALAYLIVLAALAPAGASQVRALPTIVEPVRYPPYWYRTATFLTRHVSADEPVAVLPWHLYQPLRASHWRLAANPARVFFPGRLVTPHNLEIPGRATEVTSRYDRIGVVTDSGAGICAVGQAVRRERVRWILVLDGAESAGTVTGLRRCGYVLREGRPGATAVLSSRS
jgi:hypothetical protein